MHVEMSRDIVTWPYTAGGRLAAHNGGRIRQVLLYCHKQLAKPNKYCFIKKERGTFLLSNCLKPHAM